MMRSTKRVANTGLAAMLILTLVACSSEPSGTNTEAEGEPAAADTDAESESPTGESDATTAGGAANDGGPTPLETLYEEIEGLEGEERQARLLEIAQDEGAEITWYGSSNLDQVTPVIDSFTDATDIEVNVYRALSTTTMQRLQQEADAGMYNADVVQLGGEIIQADELGLLGPANSPVLEDLYEPGVSDNWVAHSLTRVQPVWNTTRVDEAPSSWEDVLTNFGEGRLALEVRDWDIFAMIVQEYMVEELDMSREEAVDMWKTAASGAQCTTGHTAGVTQLIAGQFDIFAMAYHHRAKLDASEGAPLAWEPSVEPVVVFPAAIGISAYTENPASALLYFEHMLSPTGQEVFAAEGRTPSNTTVEGGIPSDLDTIYLDPATIQAQSDEWEPIYDEVLNECGNTL